MHTHSSWVPVSFLKIHSNSDHFIIKFKFYRGKYLQLKHNFINQYFMYETVVKNLMKYIKE